MRWRRQGLRVTLLVAVGIVCVGLGVAGYATHALRRAELATVDARFSVRGDESTPRDVVVVAVDARTFDDLGVRWPFPRSLHGRVIDRLRRAGARTIAYDVQFTEATTPDEDFALYDAVGRAGNVVLGTTEVAPGGHTNILGGDENLRRAHAVGASANYLVDAGGVIHRIPYEVDGLSSFARAAAERAQGRPVPRSAFGDDGAWIDYRGPAGHVRTLSFSDVMRGRFPASAVRGKVVVVGASAPSLQDVHATPTSAAMPGPEIQANAIDTLLRGGPLRPVPGWVNVLLIVVLGALAPLLGLRLGGLVSSGLALVALAGFLIAAQLTFDSGRIVSVVYPAGALAAATVAGTLVHYFTEVRERRRTRAAFARFVPPSVVDQVLEQADDGLRLGGVEVEGTVLFSDVRGFTSFSEVTPAPQVLEILNRYLTEMTAAILEHGGTLTTYIGDGIMAVFGAPIHQPDHADRALATAREMICDRLPAFNAWLAEHGLAAEPFKIGIGLNSGKFMAGNVGSEQRLDYTAIGDTINTAARLEGMTKGSGHALYIADSTRDALVEGCEDLIYVDEMPVRGRQATIRIWSLPDGSSSQPDSGAEEAVAPPAGGR